VTPGRSLDARRGLTVRRWQRLVGKSEVDLLYLDGASGFSSIANVKARMVVDGGKSRIADVRYFWPMGWRWATIQKA
jgi:hypothetical protein